MFKELRSIGSISAKVGIEVGVVSIRVIRILPKSITQVAAFLVSIGSLELRVQLFSSIDLSHSGYISCLCKSLLCKNATVDLFRLNKAAMKSASPWIPSRKYRYWPDKRWPASLNRAP